MIYQELWSSESYGREIQSLCVVTVSLSTLISTFSMGQYTRTALEMVSQITGN